MHACAQTQSAIARPLIYFKCYNSPTEVLLTCIKKSRPSVLQRSLIGLMINHPGIAVLLLLPSLALADGNADAVNERIPVNKAEMEAHWQVDCAAAREHLLAAATQSTNKDNCIIPGELQREIQLCAFIYQAPGDSPQHRCPDYRSAAKHLQQAAKPAKCSNLLTSTLQKADCQAEIQ